MPSVFSHEEWFMLGVGGLIALLLVLRFRIARKRRAKLPIPPTPATGESAGQPPPFI